MLGRRPGSNAVSVGYWISWQTKKYHKHHCCLTVAYLTIQVNRWRNVISAAHSPYRLFPWWRHQMETFSALLVICAGIHRLTVNSQHKGQWRGALIFSLIYAWINVWVNYRKAGDLRRFCAHYGVIVMTSGCRFVAEYNYTYYIYIIIWKK